MLNEVDVFFTVRINSGLSNVFLDQIIRATVPKVNLRTLATVGEGRDNFSDFLSNG